MKRFLFPALLAAVAVTAAVAAGGDNAAVMPGGGKPAPSGGPSYFEGTWAGAWPAYEASLPSQDITVKIERGRAEGVFIVDYSWGAVSWRRGTIPPGSVKTRGREDGDRFVFQWTNKMGRTVEITLRKHENDTVKARIEKSGPVGPAERPYNETTLKRK